MSPVDNNSTKRLNKRLVELGLADSRRKADTLIEQGNVKVNGQVAHTGMQIVDSDVVTVLDKKGIDRPNISIVFNKPKGYLCSHLDKSRTKTIFHILPKAFAQLKIAGRLDRDSQGLMILSSDGALVQQLTHPKNHKEKEYVVTLTNNFNSTHIKPLLQGVKLNDGTSKFLRVVQMKPRQLRVVLGEGRNRQIRRTFEAIGYKVAILERTRIANINLGLLAPGKFEFLSLKDIEQVMK